MARKNKLHVAFLWHMHQPPYEDPRTRCNMLPWTWCHAVKDYYDMGALLLRHPRMRVNVNFTPSLLLQLSQYENGTFTDRTLELLAKDPARLSPVESEFLLRTCLGVTEPLYTRFPRYREIIEWCRGVGPQGDLAPEDWTDLGVLFLLAWCGPTLSAHPDVMALVRKGRGYTAADRERLVELGRDLISKTVPLYRELSASGQVELSTSPFFHPLTPLLISNSIAIEARPNTVLPDIRFAAPEEAEHQIGLGIDYFARTFGEGPKGMWPPEGAVSDAMLSMVAAHGIRWLATDEEILRRSLGGESSPHERRSAHVHDGVSLFFRDRVLSDHIGFVYSRWPVDHAVNHFMSTLRAQWEEEDRPDAIVLVALDGENAWEFYPNGGYPFLDALYTAIEQANWLKPVTLSWFLDHFGPGQPLEILAPGTWVDGNFDTWIGDPAKNRAWSMLAVAWQVARDIAPGPCEPNGVLKQPPARCHLMRAEASDWFWWFGKGHSSIHEREFDYLFREHLRMVYEHLGVQPPDSLDHPVGGETGSNLPVTAPSALIDPEITGRREGYYKWVGAGASEFAHGSIHRLQPILAGVRFGYNRTRLFFRIDGFEPLGPMLTGDGWLRVQFTKPCQCAAVVRREADRLVVFRSQNGNGVEPVHDAVVAAEELVELALPVSFFDSAFWGRPPVKVEFRVIVGRGHLEVERFPWDAVISMDFDPDSIALNNWFV